jgi:hypothetical protein
MLNFRLTATQNFNAVVQVSQDMNGFFARNIFPTASPPNQIFTGHVLLRQKGSATWVLSCVLPFLFIMSLHTHPFHKFP